jgi:hypothetical protein
MTGTDTLDMKFKIAFLCNLWTKPYPPPSTENDSPTLCSIAKLLEICCFLVPDENCSGASVSVMRAPATNMCSKLSITVEFLSLLAEATIPFIFSKPCAISCNSNYTLHYSIIIFLLKLFITLFNMGLNHNVNQSRSRNENGSHVVWDPRSR